MPSYAASAALPAKMSYAAASGTVICRSKMHLGLKRNCQVMPGGETTRFGYRHQPRHRDSERVRASRAKARGASRSGKQMIEHQLLERCGLHRAGGQQIRP